MMVSKLLACSLPCPLADHIILTVEVVHLCVRKFLSLLLLALPTLCFDLFPAWIRRLQPEAPCSLTISLLALPYLLSSPLPQLWVKLLALLPPLLAVHVVTSSLEHILIPPPPRTVGARIEVFVIEAR